MTIRRPRVRFAPDSHAVLGLAEARIGLFSWLFARGRDGTFLLWLAGTDADQGRQGGIADDLLWLGLGWDEACDLPGRPGSYRRSERLGQYRTRVEDLLASGAAYRCFCEPRRGDPDSGTWWSAGCASVESGSCRHLSTTEVAARCRSEAGAVCLDAAAVLGARDAVLIADAARGTIRHPAGTITDFVLLDRDETPSCDFAAAIDDVAMEISHVIRDHHQLAGTIRRELIFDALDVRNRPLSVHLPPISGPQGVALGRPEADVSIRSFREQGYPSAAIINYLALLGWRAVGGQQLLTREELIGEFDLRRIATSPVRFEMEKLEALATRHMERMPVDGIAALAAEHLARSGVLRWPVSGEGRRWAGGVARLFSDRLPKMSDLPAAVRRLFEFDPARCLAEPDAREVFGSSDSRRVVEALVARLGEEPLSASRFQALAEEVRRVTGARGRRLYEPLRIALTGRGSGPELVKLLPLIEEGKRLGLPRPIAGCAERARRLFEASAKATL